jgi:hypothetical protein
MRFQPAFSSDALSLFFPSAVGLSFLAVEFAMPQKLGILGSKV